MPREGAPEKGRRLLTEGRLNVLRRSGDDIEAEIRGDSGEVYRVGYRPDTTRWYCTCPVRTDACSHLVALRLVTVKIGPGSPRSGPPVGGEKSASQEAPGGPEGG